MDYSWLKEALDARRWVVIVTWQEPETGAAVYGPYLSEQEAKDNIPKIEPHFVNPFSSEEEAIACRECGCLRDAEACKGMGFEWGGYLGDDIEFIVQPFSSV